MTRTLAAQIVALTAVLSIAPAYADDLVYLLTRITVNGTTLAEAALLHDQDATTLADCQQDIVRGQNGQWQYYGHAIRKMRGVATTVSYNCVTSDLDIEEWQYGPRYTHVYLFDRRGAKLRIAAHDNYAACIAALQQIQKAETDTFFCAKSNQTIRIAQ